MENHNPTERTVPIQFVRGSRAFKQFKNPPQPHMCIQDTIKDTTEKLFINVLGWQKIANPKQYTDPIPLYGGMQVPQGCGPNSAKPPLLVFAVMVNPDILKANGKNAANPGDREALVSLLCDFVEAMNPGLVLNRNPVIMKDKDLAGELKDVWLAVQNKREREKGMNQDVMYKVYDIDGVGNEDLNDDDKLGSPRSKQNDPSGPNRNNAQNKETDKRMVKSSKQILLNAGQTSEFDSGMNNSQIIQNSTNRETRVGNQMISKTADTTYCTPVYGQIVSTRENHNQVNDIQQKFSIQESITPSTSHRKEWDNEQGHPSERWDEFSEWDISSMKNGHESRNQKCIKSETNKKRDVQINNGKAHYDFFPVFDNKTVAASSNLPQDVITNADKNGIKDDVDSSKVIIEPMQKLVLHSTDNKICDNKTSALSSISS